MTKGLTIPGFHDRIYATVGQSNGDTGYRALYRNSQGTFTWHRYSDIQ